MKVLAKGHTHVSIVWIFIPGLFPTPAGRKYLEPRRSIVAVMTRHASQRSFQVDPFVLRKVSPGVDGEAGVEGRIQAKGTP